jgi:predicted nucleotide-binding protein (sugar kinase/HSP70/actin superfamily)
MWRRFLEELGVEVVTSTDTTREMLNAGGNKVVAETCLPVKIFMGHVTALQDRVDCLFIPAIRSAGHRAYNCPKFLGLPDLTRAVIPRCPPVIDPELDASKGPKAVEKTVWEAGKHFTKDKGKVERAARAAWETHKDYLRLMREEGLAPGEASARLFGDEGLIHPHLNPLPSRERGESTAGGENPINIAVIGHPYLIHDPYVSHRLIRRLRAQGVRVFTPEMAPARDLDAAMARLTGQPRWTYEADVVGAGGYYLEDRPVDGIIAVIAFACGPDSVMMNVVQRRALAAQTAPVMTLTLDEHTGEAGIITRLEAFLDMIRRRKRVAACA